ncbi:MAG: tRNA (adenosine(37)-N6)-dimethylallyltransferase MiaA [Candidatus Paceibacterota bacterium]
MAKNKRLKLIIVVGPTASGKSDLAIDIAKKVDGEVVSADSRQVYLGMDIGSGKITKKEMRGVPHHMLDIVSPKVEFNVVHFKKKAEKIIKQIATRKKTPIVAGGTGFWIDSLLYDFKLPEVGPDTKLRKELDKKTTVQLFEQLKKLDPARAETVDEKNRRRLIRALEIAIKTGKPVPTLKKKLKYDALIIGIKRPQKELEERIYKRLVARLKEGMIDEIKRLHESGVSWKRLDNFGLEYRYVSRYLRGLLDYDQMVDETYRAIKRYAKRQMTWFKRNKDIVWVDDPRGAIKLLSAFPQA